MSDAAKASTPVEKRESRRSFLTAAGALGALGGAAAAAGCATTAEPSMAAAPAQSGIGDPVLVILYPVQEGGTFDIDFYRDNHLTLIMRLYGDAIRRFELIEPQAVEGAPQPAYYAVVMIWIADQAKFDAAGAEHTQTLVDDVPNFSSVFPQVTNGVLYGLG